MKISNIKFLEYTARYYLANFIVFFWWILHTMRLIFAILQPENLEFDYTFDMWIVVNVVVISLTIVSIIGAWEIKKFIYFGDQQDPLNQAKWAIQSALFDIYTLAKGQDFIPKLVRENYISQLEDHLEKNTIDTFKIKGLGAKIGIITTNCLNFSNHIKKNIDNKYINFPGIIVSIFSISGLSGVDDIIAGDLHFRSETIISDILRVFITITVIPGLIILSFAICLLIGFTWSFKGLLEKTVEVPQSESSLDIEEALKLCARFSIRNIRRSTSVIAQTYLRFSLGAFLVGLVLAIWMIVVLSLPPIAAIGTTALIGIAGIIAFIFPQFNIRKVIGEEKRFLLNIIEKQYHKILIIYLKHLTRQDTDKSETDRSTLWKELGGLSDLSNRIESISEWPFNYKTFLTVLAGALFPFISILIGVLGLL